MLDDTPAPILIKLRRTLYPRTDTAEATAIDGRSLGQVPLTDTLREQMGGERVALFRAKVARGRLEILGPAGNTP